MEVFGGNTLSETITTEEFFYFLDTLFRGLSKTLIVNGEKNDKETKRTMRLVSKDIAGLVSEVFGTSKNLAKDELEV